MRLLAVGEVMQEQLIQIVHAKPYEFKDDSGNNRDGVSVTYLMDLGTEEQKKHGILPTKDSIKADQWQNWRGPGYYLGRFGLKPTAKGLQIKLESIEFQPELSAKAAK